MIYQKGRNMNKPVAWAYMKDGVFWDAIHPDEHDREEGSYTVPLYTHPVKELTDEEIKQIFLEETGFYFDDNPADDLALMDFAKAILRKAQER